MPSGLLSLIGTVFILAGALLFATAGVGLLRLRDVYARSTAIATAAGLGISTILVGVLLHFPTWENLFKVAVAIVLQLITSAIGSMAIARAAWLVGSPFYLKPLLNELEESAGPLEPGEEPKGGSHRA